MQQINLYLPELRPKTDYLSARNALCLLGVFLLVLVLGYGMTGRKINKLQNALHDVQQQNVELQNNIARMDIQPQDQRKNNLESRIAHSRRTLSNHQRLIDVLRGETLGNNRGFSQKIATLAELSHDGLSLQRFALTEGGRELHLTGRSRTTEQIPVYLNLLRMHDAFADTGFGELNIDRKSGWYEFTVNQPEKLDKNSASKSNRP